MVTWPSGKAKVCKTFIHQFKSGRHLQKPVTKKMPQAFFFVVASKISDFANQFWTRFYSVVQSFQGSFPNLMPTFPAVFRNLAGEGAIFLRKNRINPAVFRMFSISSQPISYLRGHFTTSKKISRNWRTCSVIPASRRQEFISWNPAQNMSVYSIKCTFYCEFDESIVPFLSLTKVNI